MRSLIFTVVLIITPASLSAKAEGLPDGNVSEFLVKAKVDMVGLKAPMADVPGAVVMAFAAAGADVRPTITSAAEFYDWRAASSLHLQGLAIDIRGRDLTISKLEVICEQLRDLLGSEYDVVLENFGEYNPRTHIHIEYDPKSSSSG
jgi:hypothetical protein